MKRPKKEDYIKENMHLTTGYSLAQDKYIDYLEKSLEQHHELIKTLQTHIKIQNA